MFPSARALARSLSDRLGSRVYVTTNPDTALRGPVIRWGSSNHLDVPAASILNQKEFIGTCSNKGAFSDLMVNLNVSCIEIKRGTPESFPVVVRMSLTGYGGSGIRLCKSEEEWDSFSGYYWSYWRDLHPELGVHIFNDRILRVFKKMPDESLLGEEEFPIRNASRGYHFQLVDFYEYPKLVPFMENFCRVFPHIFGRLDVGWDYENKLYRVIEFNTAPCLTDNSHTLESYTNAFLNIL